MNTKHFLAWQLVLCMLPCILLQTACSPYISDYRNKYTGIWKICYTVKEYNYVATAYRIIKGEFSGRISFTTKQNKRTLLIRYTPSQEDLFQIDKEGNFTDCDAKGKFMDLNHFLLIKAEKIFCNERNAMNSYTLTGVKL